MTIENEKLEILEEFHNVVGHALIDYYLELAMDAVHKRQMERDAMDKIKLADDKALRLLEVLK